MYDIETKSDLRRVITMSLENMIESKRQLDMDHFVKVEDEGVEVQEFCNSALCVVGQVVVDNSGFDGPVCAPDGKYKRHEKYEEFEVDIVIEALNQYWEREK